VPLEQSLFLPRRNHIVRPNQDLHRSLGIFDTTLRPSLITVASIAMGAAGNEMTPSGFNAYARDAFLVPIALLCDLLIDVAPAFPTDSRMRGEVGQVLFFAKHLLRFLCSADIVCFHVYSFLAARAALLRFHSSNR